MFFSGDYRSKKSINLSGASKTKTKDELIREANIEREKRERDKKQAQAAVKIQSAYRSYLSRKALKIEYRRRINERFEDILKNCISQSQNELQIPDDFNTYFKYFVQTFDVKYDLERLLKLSQFILQKKESFIKTIIQDNKNFTYTFAKFLKVHLTVLNKSNINHSICLRLIDFFTQPNNYKTEESNNIGTVLFVFEYLIKHGYVNELTRYCFAKIPPNVDLNATNYPIVQSISDLFFRIFVYLNLNNASTNLSLSIVKSLCEQLFAKAYKSQIRYAIIERLAQLFAKQDNNSYKNMTKNVLNIFAIVNGSNAGGFDSQNSYYNVDIFSSYVKNLCILYSLLKLYQHSIDKFTNQQFRQYMNVVSQLISKLPILDESDENLLFTSVKGIDLYVTTAGNADYDDYSEDKNKFNKDKIESYMDVDDEDNDNNDKRRHTTCDEYNAFTTINLLTDEIFKLLDSKSLSNKLFTLFNTTNFDVDDNENRLFSSNISQICYYMIIISKIKAHQSNFLRTLSFNSKSFIYHLWKSICLLSVKPNENQEVYLIQLLASGSSIELYDNTLCKIVAPLTTFCSLYNLYLLPILDVEFLSGEAIFSKTELIEMCSLLKDICLGIIHLMHPDTRPILTTLFNKKQNNEITELDIKLKAIYFTHLFKACSQLVQRMYTRDIRAGFCPEDHWLSNIISVTANRFVCSNNCVHEPILTIRFGHLSYLFQDRTELVHPFSVNDVRALTVLQELPFTVPFSERVALFEHFIRNELEHDQDNVLRVRIRRSRLLEDAFQNLSLVNAPNLKKQKVTVEMENVHGLDEAGIDGGGVFREFLLDLLKASFDPDKVFFTETIDGCLYPNPQSRTLDVILQNESASRQDFYFFVGRMLAKAIQSKLLCDIKLAGFFLQKILSKYSDSRLDIDYLASMDPVIYKSLMDLKNEKEDEKVERMDLTFSVDVDVFGAVKTVEFKPNGKDLKVTNENKIEFMHLMADYKLNKQINEQVAAFRNGMANIIDLEYLRLFNFNELQNLISGPDHIDVNDWKLHTVYGNGFDEYDEVIKTFWRIVEDFTEEQRKKLLKFATSRSRAPLFGFKNIIPNFAIHSSFDTDRLPTANTCFNLLKLPPIEDYNLLKEKLLKSIESNAGFEYS